MGEIRNSYKMWKT